MIQRLNLEAALKEVGICTDGLKKDDEVHTTLALVHKLENGDRDFSFYRKPGADMMLRAEEVEEEFLDTAIFHLGSLSLTDQPVKDATLKALSLAEKNGCLITFDPNLREPLWDSLDHAKEEIAFVMGHCQVMKISDNEVQWFTGLKDYDEGIAQIRKLYPNTMIRKIQSTNMAYHTHSTFLCQRSMNM